MRISDELLQQIVAHALEEPQNEVCGVVAVSAGSERPHALRVLRARNIHASPLKFEIAPAELLALSNECDELGGLGAIYHSHVRSKPYPSQTDVNFAANWPGVEWIIVGLAGASSRRGEGEDGPDVHSYLIDGGEVREVPLEVA